MSKGNTIFKDIFLENKVKVHLVINKNELTGNIRQYSSNLLKAKEDIGTFGSFFLHSRYENNLIKEIMFESHIIRKDLPELKNNLPRLDLYLIYQFSNGKLSLCSLSNQNSKWIRFTESRSLFPKLNTNIPFETTLIPENGIYKYPFLRSEGKESAFEFPESYKTPQNLIEFFDRCPKGVRKVN